MSGIRLGAMMGIAALGALAVGAGIAKADMMSKVGPGEGEVAIVAWPGYVERGDTDKNYDWVTDFEKQTGCKVTVKTAGSSDEMVSLMNAGGFDLVTASGDATLRLIAGGKVQQINTDLIPSWNTIDKRLQNGPWHTVGGKHFGVPYQWGPNVLMYNTNVFKTAPTSWNVVFEEQKLPDGKSNQGRIEAYYGPIYIADAALYLKKHQPGLKIEDPYELTQEQFDAAVNLLKSQRKLVLKYWSDATAQTEDFKNEGVVASTSWPYQANLLAGEGQPVGMTVPEEGATGWADTTMMHSQAPHPNCAYLWLEHSLDKKLQGDLASWFGSVPVVPEACKGNALLGEKGCEANGVENFDKISFWKTPVADCGNGKKCVPYKDWTAAYLAIQSGQ
ncbi:MAG TPA: ABC transporter substrate-binding protein [Hypericibacter adhaerens]|jgi:putative spermidine/putrescine transport system substrate-binding protein|uniref:Spermidine/putrescine ABC transporter substrate-binding protein n=1 Tax=Hypericibacter adhaerens TaxID=2602016 RepID=A0A5J6N9X7_9PROT|nr:ABC transporter substrate-binding protein [Hypericibacter adhaerens]QEX24386.1 spermidine/putrescine ABC transporter substrate-binding protein [Hypericibacter adhaerens]HWA42391.1 ABC transporter substrate-binding protein [Hypericibacter adhaerens]